MGEGTVSISDYSAKPDWTDASRGIEGSWDRTDWQRMWIHTQSRDWRTLALVPGDDQTSTFDVANLIVRLGLDHGESIQVADLRELRMKHVDAFLEGTRWEVDHGGRVIFATRSPSTNLATVPLARAADCAILCVSLGLSSLDGVRDAVAQIGPQHFLGSLLVRAAVGSDSRSHALSQPRSAAKARS